MLGLQDGGYCDAGLLTENVSYLTIDLEQGAKLKKKRCIWYTFAVILS